LKRSAAFGNIAICCESLRLKRFAALTPVHLRGLWRRREVCFCAEPAGDRDLRRRLDGVLHVRSRRTPDASDRQRRGHVTRAYDGLDRLTSETSAQGTVTYTYDAANRLTSLQAPNQGLINYGYDNDNRLPSITQGTASIVFAYDNASRRTSGTTPSGSWAYTYDVASQLTQIAYTGCRARRSVRSHTAVQTFLCS
jgi:YD repeat-containing protein